MSDERLGLSSASSFYIDAACDGRQNLLRELRETEPAIDHSSSDELALRGTRIHRARETENTMELSPDEVHAYNDGLKIERGLVLDWAEEHGIESYSEGPREERMWLHHPETLAPLVSAQLDVHYLSNRPGYLLVADWKTSSGKSAAPIAKNWQVRIQALVAWKEYPATRTCRVALIKPEAFGAQSETCDISKFEIDQIERAAFHIVWKTQQPDAQLSAGVHCRWCSAKSRCPAALAWAMQPMNTLEVVPEANGKLSKKDVIALVNLAPIESVREVFARRGVIKNIMDAVAVRLAGLPEEERYRLSLKLNRGRSTDYVRDVKSAFDLMIASGFPEDEIWGCLSLSKTDVVQMVQRFYNCRDSEADTWFESQFDEFIERERGDPIIAEA